jgi:ribosomal protein S18 acetylase RimI-like enzyme
MITVLTLTPDTILNLKNLIEDFFERNNKDEIFFHPHRLSYDGILTELQNNPKNYYVFFINLNSILGYGLLRGWQEGYDIPSLGIIIDINERGKGLSMKVMHHLENIAKSKNAKKIRLSVFKENKKAVSLYNKLGYIFSDKNEKELIGIKNL